MVEGWGFRVHDVECIGRRAVTGSPLLGHSFRRTVCVCVCVCVRHPFNFRQGRLGIIQLGGMKD